MKGYAVILLFLIAACTWAFISAFQNFSYSALSVDQLNGLEQIIPDPNDHTFAYSSIEREMLEAGLVDIESLIPDIIVQLSYTTPNNFTGQILYPDLKRAFIHPSIVKKLQIAQTHLKDIDSTLSLVVLDAARPQSVQRLMWEWAIENSKRKYVAAPSMGSVHNFGAAVDVTIASQDSLMDMGTVHDHFGPEAEPRYNWRMLREGKISQDQYDNRTMLRQVMRKAGFRPIDTEWWHFNGVTKEYARKYFRLIE